MTKYPKVRPNAMTATSIAPYLDFGVTVDAELALTVDGELEAVLEPELVVALERAEVAVVFAADPEPVAVDNVVAAVEFPLPVPVTDEVIVVLLLDEDGVGVWTKTPPDEEDWMLEVTEDATLADGEDWMLDATDEETALPLQEPEILILS